MAETIFVQIASYRDPELVKTLDDLFSNADKPKNLHVCIAFQYSDKDEFTNELDKYRDDKRLTIIDIPYQEAKGACWARNQIQQHYNNETYTLQLDSHHRFVKGWDSVCISMLKKLQANGHTKPLITSYIPSYNPSKDPEDRVKTPWGMSFDRFTPEGVVFFLPYYMENVTEPVKARFYSAHFAFTIGAFAKEVQHDPEYYFHGEEITIAVRAFTHGYDLFYPNELIAWHEYTRQGRTKQWDDDSTWGDRNKYCHKKMRSLLNIDGENEIQELEYGLGDVRTLKEYETYAGIKFTDRSITQKCKKNDIPPGNIFEPYFQEFKHAIDLHSSQFPERDYTFCVIAFQDDKGNELHRQDMTGAELLAYLKNDSFTVWRQYNGPKPKAIIVWPHSESKSWGERIVINI